MFITLRPRDQRDASATQIVNRLRPQLAQPPEGTVVLPLQAAQDINVGGRPSAAAVPIHDPGRRPRGAQRLGAVFFFILQALRQVPQLRDVSTDLPGRRDLHPDRRD